MKKSPNYPAIGLTTAIEEVKKMWESDSSNKMTKSAVAKHLRHNSLSGPALTKIATLKSYGLLSGASDELSLSELAIEIISEPEKSEARLNAIRKAARSPKLFSTLLERFPNKPSEENLKSYLIKNKFTSSAINKIITSFLDIYAFSPQKHIKTTEHQPVKEEVPSPQKAVHTPDVPDAIVNTFDLGEGQVSIKLPRTLSQEDYEDFKDWLALVIKRAGRSVQDKD